MNSQGREGGTVVVHGIFNDRGKVVRQNGGYLRTVKMSEGQLGQIF